MIKAIAVDDEPRALEVVAFHANKIPSLEIIKCFSDPELAFEHLENNMIELLFLDINMPGLTGLEMMKKLSNPPLVIFTTAYSEYALDSYELEAIDYLLKPIKFTRFLKAFHKAQSRLDIKISQDLVKPPEYIFLQDGYRQVKIKPSEIIYIKADANYLSFFTKNSKVMSRMTFSQVSEDYFGKSFLRIHNSFMINLGHFSKIENNSVYLYDTIIPIGVTFRNIIKEKIKFLSGNQKAGSTILS